ncbi:hypothetical protein QU39_00280, partial [Staphylococcus aureus]
AETVEALLEPRGLAGLDEAEMPLRQDEAGIPHDRPEDRDPDPAQPVLDEAAMARARNLVEDDAGEPHPRIVGPAAEGDRGRRLRRARDVEHQHHRPAVAGGDVGIRPRAPGARDDAVVEAHGTLGDDDPGIPRRQGRRRVEERIVHGEGIE